jgi:hypothetical protein
MPPNRKTDLGTSNAPTLNISQLKRTGVATRPAAAAAQACAANYWDWPLDQDLQQRQREETATRILSVEHIEANLVSESQRLQTSMSPMIVAQPSDATPVNYWD